MNDLKELWQKSNPPKADPEFALSDLKLLQERSDSPFFRLRRSLIANTIFATFFLGIFLILLFSIPEQWFQTLIFVVCLSYVAGIAYNLYILRKYLHELPRDSSMLSYLQTLSSGMKKAISTVEYSAILIYPFAITAGFLLPFSLEGQPDLVLKNNILMVVLFCTLLILTPLCFWLARVLNKRAFGRYIKEIDVLLNQFNQDC
ncbi:MAG: hypothetical protein KDC13_00305 [Bacteroidetes bacterium]|nr:hypothetical protein [Bacteroidota bacterium]